jgi:hypothetical protein
MNLLAASFFLNFALAIFWGIGNSGTINSTFCQFQVSENLLYIFIVGLFLFLFLSLGFLLAVADAG